MEMHPYLLYDNENCENNSENSIIINVHAGGPHL